VSANRARVNPYRFFGGWVAAVAVAMAVLGYFLAELTPLAAYFLGINFGGFVLMGLDKSLAKSGSLRAPEKIIFGVAALGGAAGILLAMHFVRHKTQKAAFQAVLVLIIGAQVFLASKLGVQLRQSSIEESYE
jgi:uncharacterized membrane protein YsdA (DUF1294 family)